MKRGRRILFISLSSLAGLLLVGAVVLWLLLPTIVRSVVAGAVSDNTLMTMELGDVEVDGLTSITLIDLRLTDPADGDREVIYIERLEVDLDGLPLGGDVHVADIRVTNPRATAVRDLDGKLNLARLVTPKPGDGETTIDHVTVRGADLRLLTLLALKPGGEATEGDDDVAPHRLAQLQDVDVELSLVDPATKAYDMTLTIADPAWGPVTIDGHLATTTGAARLAMTRGDLHVGPENLATLPDIPEALIAEMKPEARILLKKFASGPEGTDREVDLDVSDIAVTPGGVNRLSGMTLVANVANDVLTVKLRDVPKVAPEGTAASVGDIQADLTVNLASGKLDLNIPKASIMSGNVTGRMTVPDIRAEQLLPEGKLTASGIRMPVRVQTADGEERQVIVKLDASLDFHEDLASGALAAALKGQVGMLEPAEKGAPPGSEAELLDLPIQADWSLDLKDKSKPIPLKVTVGNDESPFALQVDGAVDHKNRVLTLANGGGVIHLTQELFDAAALFNPRAEQAGRFLQGDISFSTAPQTRVPLDAPQRMTGRVIVSSDNLAFVWGKKPEKVQLRLQLSPETGPDNGVEARLSMNFESRSGSISAKVTFDAQGNPVAPDVKVDKLYLDDQDWKTLALVDQDFVPPERRVPSEYRRAVRELPPFKMIVDATLTEERAAGTGARNLHIVGAVQFPEQQGRVSTDCLYSASANALSGTGDVKDVRLTRALIDSLRPALLEFDKTLAERLDKELARAPAFAVTVSGQSPFKADLAAGKFTSGKTQFSLADLSATIAQTLDGQPATIALTGGQCQATLTETMDLDEASLAVNVFGGRALSTVKKASASEQLTIHVEIPGSTPLRFEQLPEPIRRKVPEVSRGTVAGKVTVEAPSIEHLLRQQLSGSAALQVRGAHLTFKQDSGEPLAVVAGCDTTVKLTLPPGDEPTLPSSMIVNVPMVSLADAEGKGYLPAGSLMKLQARVDGRRNVTDSQLAIRLPGTDGVQCKGTYDHGKGDVGVTVEKMSLDLASLWQQRLAAPVRERFEKLAPQGRVAGGGNLKLNLRAGSLLDSAVYDFKLTGDQISAVNPKTGVRSPARDVSAALRRAVAADSHWATIVSRHPTDGSLQAKVGYSPKRLSVQATLEKFVLAPELAALVGGQAKACNPAGLFDGTVTANLSRDTLGRWIPSEMSGELTGRNLSGNGPDGMLKFAGGLLKVTLAPDKITLETFEGTLADGKVKASIAALLPPVRDDPKLDWRFEGGKLNVERIDLRQFEAVAKRPPNELQGRLWIDMASEDDYGFAGPLADRNAWKAKGKVRFGEGHLWRMPLMKELQGELFKGLANVLRAKFDPTSFRLAEGEFTVADGKVTQPGTTVDSDMIRMLVTGDVHLANRLDLKIATSFRLNVDDRGGDLGNLIPGLNKELDRVKDILKHVPGGEIPLLMGYYTATGTFDDPKLEKQKLDDRVKVLFKTGLDFLDPNKDKDKKTDGGDDKPGDKPEEKKPAKRRPIFRIPLP